MIETKTRPVGKSLPRFVPVIFGNGEDDDTPGMEACFNNEAVQVDDRVYETDEDVTIYGMHIVVYRTIIAAGGGSRHIYITKCFLDYRGP